MIYICLNSPIDIDYYQALKLNREAIDSGYTIFIQKQNESKILMMNSLLSLLFLKVKKGDEIILSSNIKDKKEGKKVLTKIVEKFNKLSY